MNYTHSSNGTPCHIEALYPQKKTKKEKAILINTVRRKCAVKNTQKCHIRIIYCVSMCG